MVILIAWIVFIRLEQNPNLICIKKYVKIKFFCSVSMPSEDIKILEFNQYEKFDKTPFIYYADLEFLIKKGVDVKIIMKSYLQQI